MVTFAENRSFGLRKVILPGPEREKLPIDEHASKIIRACRDDPVTLIQGETGSGKSSRIPQYIYHHCQDRAAGGSALSLPGESDLMDTDDREMEQSSTC